jgi:uncharacterized membrane protein
MSIARARGILFGVLWPISTALLLATAGLWIATKLRL